MMHLFKNKSFSLKDIDAGHHKVTYRGVKTVKCPFDYVIYQMLLCKIKPDLVIEIGTHRGGSSLYLADLLELNQHGIVHTIDLPGNEVDPLVTAHPRISVFSNGYMGYETSELKRYDKIMIIEDGSHQYEDTLATLRRFAPYVTPGSYFIVEDGIVNELGMSRSFNGGPQRAIKEFLLENDQFTIDREYCDLFGKNATFNVNGYLKRIPA
jgi:cephalosporin hydroxylase